MDKKAIVKIMKLAEREKFGKHFYERQEKKVWCEGVLWALCKVENGKEALAEVGYHVD